MAYGDFKGLAKRTASDKDLRDKTFDIANQRGLASMVHKFFDRITKGRGITTLANKSAIKNEITQNQQSAEELQKTVIIKFKERRFYSSFKDNIWGADLADMQLISKFNIF